MAKTTKVGAQYRYNHSPQGIERRKRYESKKKAARTAAKQARLSAAALDEKRRLANKLRLELTELEEDIAHIQKAIALGILDTQQADFTKWLQSSDFKKNCLLKGQSEQQLFAYWKTNVNK